VSVRPLLRPAGGPTDSTSPGRLRVLLLIKGLGRGGAEQLLVNAVEHGDRSRFDYEVAYLLPWKDAFVPELEALGVRVTCLRGAKGLSWVGRLRSLVRERRVDVLHVHSPYVAAVARTALGRHRPVLVTTEHNVWERYHRSTYWANAVTFPRNDHVFAVSDEVRESIRFPRPVRFLRTPPLETLHHGIDVDRVRATPAADGVREELGIDPAVPVVGTVANFKPHKGYEYLLEVAAGVARVRPEARFVFVGQGPMRERMFDEARRLGIAETIVFAGFREDALRLVRSFDVFALSSVHEGLPLALLEAMALGCPPVATRVGGVGEVIHDGVDGITVEPRQPAAQAEQILRILEDDDLRGRLSAGAERRASDFDVRVAIRRIERVYGELTA
jgi:glycosyltransferase involved in cell wall biosynthesis